MTRFMWCDQGNLAPSHFQVKLGSCCQLQCEMGPFSELLGFSQKYQVPVRPLTVYQSMSPAHL